MADLLKNLYNPQFFERILPVFKRNLGQFDENRFIHCVFDDEWPDLELKQRVRKISTALHVFMPSEFPKCVEILKRLVKDFTESFNKQGFELIFLADYVEQYGKDFFSESMDAIETITALVSCEYAIRPFLISQQKLIIAQLVKWSKHPDANVRRLASEGCRPRLPWAMGVPELKKHPELILPVLSNLKDDPSEYVRRSVANNLNDISKDHPQLVLSIAKDWKGISERTDKLVRHACRGLMRQGSNDVFLLHGYRPQINAELREFLLSRKKVAIGGELSFRLKIRNAEATLHKFRLDYGIDYLTSTGKTSRKVFKLKDGYFSPGEEVVISKTQKLKHLSTRRLYKGKHTLSILINGETIARKEFALL